MQIFHNWRRWRRHGMVDTVETSASLVRKLRKPSYFNGRKAPRPEVLTLFRVVVIWLDSRVASSYRDIVKDSRSEIAAIFRPSLCPDASM